MKIVVNHLTRMRSGYICVAGIDPATGRHVRPIAEDDRWRRPSLVRNDGPFDIAAVVELGRAGYEGRPPEVEDHRVRPNHCHRLHDLPAREFWALLTRVARPRLREIFGDDLHPAGPGFAVDEGRGSASLGCLILSKPPILTVTSHGDVRLSFSAAPSGPSVKVTDLRLYDGSPAMPRHDVVASLTQRMGQGVGVILSVGLGRPFQRDGDDAPRHWLQVNNIHLEDDPAWTERISGNRV